MSYKDGSPDILPSLFSISFEFLKEENDDYSQVGQLIAEKLRLKSLLEDSLKGRENQLELSEVKIEPSLKNID